MVGIYHELEVGPYGLPDGLDPLEILGHGEEPHLHLDSPEAGLLEGPGLLCACPDTLPNVNGARILMVMSGLITITNVCFSFIDTLTTESDAKQKVLQAYKGHKGSLFWLTGRSSYS